MNVSGKTLAGILLIAITATSSSAPKTHQPDAASDYEFEIITVDNEEYGFVLRKAVWEFKFGQEKIIPVCWENPSKSSRQALNWVRDAVEQSWQRHSRLKFVGWQKCDEENPGIRIGIVDEDICVPIPNQQNCGPFVHRLGNQIDGQPYGMMLNHSFRKWNQGCLLQKELCVRAIAVHEFGHAIGLAHEQNRSDAPGECEQLRQGEVGDMEDLTPYDPGSVMNYCDKRHYAKGGALSEIDILTVQSLYCSPDDAFCS